MMRTIVRSVRAKKQHAPLRPLAVVGAGNIGNAMALAFAAAGRPVRLWDDSGRERALAADRIAAAARGLEEFGLLADACDAVMSRIDIVDRLADALDGAVHVQECVPEDLALKRSLFEELDRLCDRDTVIASSTSAIMPSAIAGGLAGRRRCLVVHPGNPPSLIRVVEVVPAKFTAREAVDVTCHRLEAAGLSPIVVRREIPGFVFNRLQGAVLREAYCLVRDGVASVEDIDRIVRDGLGLRWSVIGPFETADLNRRGGIRRHAEIMGEAYAAMGAERGQDDPWTPDLVADVEAQRRALLPLEQWEQRVQWRDRRLMRLIAERLRSEPD